MEAGMNIYETQKQETVVLFSIT